MSRRFADVLCPLRHSHVRDLCFLRRNDSGLSVRAVWPCVDFGSQFLGPARYVRCVEEHPRARLPGIDLGGPHRGQVSELSPAQPWRLEIVRCASTATPNELRLAEKQSYRHLIECPMHQHCLQPTQLRRKGIDRRTGSGYLLGTRDAALSRGFFCISTKASTTRGSYIVPRRS